MGSLMVENNLIKRTIYTALFLYLPSRSLQTSKHVQRKISCEYSEECENCFSAHAHRKSTLCLCPFCVAS